MQSPLYNELPINYKLKLYYCQFFYLISLDFFFNPGPDFFILLDKFDNEFDPLLINELQTRLFYYAIKIQTLMYKNKYDQAKDLESPCLEIIAKLNLITTPDNETKKIIALFYFIFFRILTHFLNSKEELNYLLKSFELWVQINDYFNRFCIIEYLFYSYLSNNLNEKAIEFLEQNLFYYRNEKNANPLYCSFIFIFISNYYLDKDLKLSLKYIDEAFNNINSNQVEKGNEFLIDLMLNYYRNKGYILELMGNIEGSIEASKSALKYLNLFQEHHNQVPASYGIILGDLGEAIAQTGNLNLALEYQLEALNSRIEEYESKLSHFWLTEFYLAESYYQLIQLYLKLGKENDAKRYFTEFEKLIQSEQQDKLDKKIKNQFKLAKGLIFRYGDSFEDIGKAKILLLEVINGTDRFEIMADAIVPLIDITIKEYKLFQSQKNFQEILYLINKLEELGEKNNSITLKIYSLLLGGKIELINGNIEKTENMYKESIKIAKDFNLSSLVTETTLELEVLQKDMGNWKKILLDSSIKERFDLLNLEDYIKESKKLLNLKND